MGRMTPYILQDVGEGDDGSRLTRVCLFLILLDGPEVVSLGEGQSDAQVSSLRGLELPKYTMSREKSGLSVCASQFLPTPSLYHAENSAKMLTRKQVSASLKMCTKAFLCVRQNLLIMTFSGLALQTGKPVSVVNNVFLPK